MRNLIKRIKENRAVKNERRRKALMTWNGIVYFNTENTSMLGRHEVVKDKKMVMNLTRVAHMEKAKQAAKNR